MKIAYIIRILFIFIIILPVACNYEDGPLFSIYSKKQRVVGKWTVDKYTKNGNDNTSLIIDQPCYSPWKFSDDGDDGIISSYAVYYSVVNSDTVICITGGSWSFSNDRREIIIGFNGSPVEVGAYAATANVSWEIVKLTNKKMWLRTEYQNNLYELHFAKTDD